MGYSLQIDVACRERTPGVSRARPKTHTPGPQLQQRGFRYYSPELGRWLSRDPMLSLGPQVAPVAGGEDYTFLGNNAVDRTDYLGLLAVTDIPGIMSALGWTEAAALMNKWFARPAHIIDEDVFEPAHTDHSIITMSWALSFARARAAYDGIITGKKYVNASSRTRIWDYINTIGVPAGSRFGDFFFSGTPFMKNSVISGDNWTFRDEYGTVFDPSDGLKAGLGRWDFVSVTSGTVLSKGASSACVSIDRVGTFIFDNFDFELLSPTYFLGWWRQTPPYGGMLPVPGSVPVTSGDFHLHRLLTGMGGDFFYFSDLKTESVSEVKLVP